MHQSMRIAIAAAAVAVVAIVGFGFLRSQNLGGPGPSPSPAWVTFTSERYGYAIDHPSDWRVQSQGGGVLPRGQELRAPGTDLIGSSEAFQTDDGLISISAHDLEPGETLSEFTDRFSANAACGEVSVRSDTRLLGGEEAEDRDMTCSEWAWLQVTALHGDRGYVIWLVATAPPDPEQRPINHEILATFRFTD